jgi:hypothetical protein
MSGRLFGFDRQAEGEFRNGPYVHVVRSRRPAGATLVKPHRRAKLDEGNHFAPAGSMIEHPPKPDVPHQPDVINHPPRVNTPVMPGDPEPEHKPDIHPVPPPTDPSPPII